MKPFSRPAAADWPQPSDVLTFYAHLFGAPALRIPQAVGEDGGISGDQPL